MSLDRVFPPRFGRRDRLILIGLAVLTGSLVWFAAARIDPRFVREPDGNDVWFEADLPTIADRVLHRWSDQSRNARHPLFPLLATVPAYGLRSLGLTETTALRAVISAFAAAWSAPSMCCCAQVSMARRTLSRCPFAPPAAARA